MLVDIEQANLESPLPGITEQLPGQALCALHLAQDLLEPFEMRMGLLEIHGHDVRISLDDGQQIVEIVGDSCGQSTD